MSSASSVATTLAVDDAVEAPRRVEVAGVGYVVARLGEDVVAARDRCPHRGAPLSAGTIKDSCLVCPYHGWRFGSDGKVAEIPALGADAALPPRASLELVPVYDDGDGGVELRPQAVPRRNLSRTDSVLANDTRALRRAWHPVCRSDEVVPGAPLEVQLLGETMTLERDSTHAIGAPGAAAAVDHLGHVWVAPDAPLMGLLEVPELEQPGWQHVAMPRVEGSYGVGLLLDNQLDAGHFAFVHRDTFGSGAAAVVPGYDLRRSAWGFETTFAVPISARNDAGVAAGERSLAQHRTMTYRYQAPTGLFLRLDYEEMGGSTGIVFCFSPLDASHARMDVDLYFRRPGGFSPDELAERLAFEIQVVREDMALQDRFPTTLLPIDPTAEVHTKADKAALEMRRILQRLLED